MNWIDIASIVFVCVTMNHLGLIEKIEEVTGKEFVVLNCPKCGSFWLSLLYGLWGMNSLYGELPTLLAVSFLASYMAIWFELFEGYIDTLYLNLYDKIYNTKDNPTATDANEGYSASTLPKL